VQALASFFTGDPTHGVAGFYGGSTQVHLGPGPAVDSCHRAALRAALLTASGSRSPTRACIEVVQRLLTAGRFPADPAVLDGAVLILETSEEIIPAREFGWILRSLGERGLLTAANAVLVARPPASSFDKQPSAAERAAHRAEQREVAIELVGRYNPHAVVCVGIPFGHTRPQWILPYGGEITVDGAAHRIWADYR
jgi:muramoyltetrapeptide carboxypeptidase LdcA involved in peptidoglycan recycling